MKLKAKDTLHVSSVKADNILPGEVFDVSEDTGRKLIAAGHATEVKAAKAEPKSDEAKPAAKAEDAPLNKMDPAPVNKGSFQSNKKGR